jgi:hypothetical protein
MLALHRLSQPRVTPRHQLSSRQPASRLGNEGSPYLSLTLARQWSQIRRGRAIGTTLARLTNHPKPSLLHQLEHRHGFHVGQLH